MTDKNQEMIHSHCESERPTGVDRGDSPDRPGDPRAPGDSSTEAARSSPIASNISSISSYATPVIDSNKPFGDLDRDDSRRVVSSPIHVDRVVHRIEPVPPSPRVEPLASSVEPRRVSAFLERSRAVAPAAEPIDRSLQSKFIDIPEIKKALDVGVAIDPAVVRCESDARIDHGLESRMEERRRVWAEGWNAAAAEREARQNWGDRSTVVPPAVPATSASRSYASPIAVPTRSHPVVAPKFDPDSKPYETRSRTDLNRRIDIPLAIDATPFESIDRGVDTTSYVPRVDAIAYTSHVVESRRNTPTKNPRIDSPAVEPPNVADRRPDLPLDLAPVDPAATRAKVVRSPAGVADPPRAFAARVEHGAIDGGSGLTDAEANGSKTARRDSGLNEEFAGGVKDRRSILSEYKQILKQKDVVAGATDRDRSGDAAIDVKRDEAEGGAEDEFWPSAREIFRVNDAARATGTNRLSVATKPRVDARSTIVVDLTVPRGPQGIALKFGAFKYACVFILISTFGVMTVGISWLWARDDAAAERVAERLFDARDKGSVASETAGAQGLDVPEGGWGRTTPRHLLIWAMAVDRGIASPGGDAQEKTRELLERAKHASPAFAALRYAAVWRGRHANEPKATSALALGRDVDALALTARRLLESNREEAAIAEMNRAIELAGKLDSSFELEPPATERRPGARVYQPREWIIERILRDWNDACAERRVEATKAIPDLPVAWLAAARVAAERNDSAEVRAALERAIESAGAVRARETDRSELALSFAAEAEAEARLGRLEPARTAFAKAINLTHVLNHQRAWWLEVAEIDVELGDTAAARKAIKFARDDDRDDRIARKAMELSARVAPAPKKDSALFRTSTDSRY